MEECSTQGPPRRRADDLSKRAARRPARPLRRVLSELLAELRDARRRELQAIEVALQAVAGDRIEVDELTRARFRRLRRGT